VRIHHFSWRFTVHAHLRASIFSLKFGVRRVERAWSLSCHSESGSQTSSVTRFSLSVKMFTASLLSIYSRWPVSRSYVHSASSSLVICPLQIRDSPASVAQVALRVNLLLRNLRPQPATSSSMPSLIAYLCRVGRRTSPRLSPLVQARSYIYGHLHGHITHVPESRTYRIGDSDWTKDEVEQFRRYLATNHQRGTATPPFSSLIELDYGAVIDAIFDSTTHDRLSNLTKKYSKCEWRQHGSHVLSSMPLEQLRAIINGSLAREYHQGNPALLALYDRPTATLLPTTSANSSEAEAVKGGKVKSETVPSQLREGISKATTFGCS
jgi:hypothetical protein